MSVYTKFCANPYGFLLDKWNFDLLLALNEEKRDQAIRIHPVATMNAWQYKGWRDISVSTKVKERPLTEQHCYLYCLLVRLKMGVERKWSQSDHQVSRNTNDTCFPRRFCVFYGLNFTVLNASKIELVMTQPDSDGADGLACCSFNVTSVKYIVRYCQKKKKKHLSTPTSPVSQWHSPLKLLDHSGLQQAHKASAVSSRWLSSRQSAAEIQPITCIH